MNETQGQSRIVPANLRSALWVLALTVFSFPILIEKWWWNAGSAHPVDESEAFRIIATLLFSGALLTFLFFAKSQKRVILIVIAILGAAATFADVIPTGRLIAIISIVVFLGILFEAIRQNLPLFRDLKSDGVSILRVAGRSAYLWCPMILVIWLGYLGNAYLLNAFENVVYSATPVDRYCETVGAENTSVLPCTSLGEVLRQSDVVELTPGDAVEAQIRDRFLTARANFILSIETTTFNGAEGLKQLAYQVNGALNLRSILNPFQQQTLIYTKVSQDRQISEFWEQIRSVPLQHQADAVRAKLDAYTNQMTAELVVEFDNDQGQQLTEVSNLFLTYLTVNNLPELDVAGRPLIDVTDKAQVDAEIGKLQFDVMVELDRLEDGAIQSSEQYFNLVRAASEGTDDALLAISTGLSATLAADADNSFFVENFPFPKNFSRQYLDAVDRAIVDIYRDRNRASRLIGGHALCRSTKLSEGVFEGGEVEGEPNSDDRQLAVINRAPFECLDPIPEEGIPLKPMGIEISAKLSAMTFQRDQAIALDQSFRALVRDAHELSDESKSSALQSINSVNNQLSLGRESCYVITPPGHCVRNMLKGVAERGYHDAMSKFQSGARSSTLVVADTANYAVEQQVFQARRIASKSNKDGQQYLNASIDKWFEYAQIASILLTLYLGLAILKSILYVVATEVFGKTSGYAINFHGQSSVQGKYEIADEIRIPSTFKRKMFTHVDVRNQEKVSKFFYKPLEAILPRIRHGLWAHLNWGSHSGNYDMIFSSDKGKKFVDWKMKEGEEVIFSYKYFFGMSENIELRTIMSLKLSTLLLGRYVFRAARCVQGDGHLILMTDGKSNSEDFESDSLDRLVAWNAHTKFQVYGGRSHKAIFVDGYQLGREPGSRSKADGLVLTNAIKRSRFRLEGIFRFVRTFLSPI